MYQQGWSFGAITDPFLCQVFSLSIVLMVSPGSKVGSQFWVSRSIAILAVFLACCLAEVTLVQIGLSNNLWITYNLIGENED